METLLDLYRQERERLRIFAEDAPRPGEYLSPVFGEGPLSPRLMFIGEAPGAEEAKSGHPFVGKAGKQLDALLQAASINRAEIFVTNTVKYRPVNIKSGRSANRTPAPEELRTGLALLEKELALVKPQIVATLGNTPLKAILLLSGCKPLTIGEAHGKILPLALPHGKARLFPLYHPASVIYNRSLAETLEADMKRLGNILTQQEGMKNER
ncbi:MAG: uracil-DNA glycosylase [Clostridiales bacterium]|nr:uracil-DNA glycosylase [Clostridiales bacterium]